jgi:hypothetical protein
MTLIYVILKRANERIEFERFKHGKQSMSLKNELKKAQLEIESQAITIKKKVRCFHTYVL